MILSEKNKTNWSIFEDEYLRIDREGNISIRNNDELIKRGITDRSFHLHILPTEQCNFRCTYCYEDYSVGRMKRETVEGIKALLDRRCADDNLRLLLVSWFGGEPLVAKDIVLEISEYIMSLVYRYPQVHYLANMTTNAYLLNYKTAASLTNSGVRHYQISLDGPREIHDRSRLRADGSSTFDQIWSNLLAIRDSSLPASVLLRLHFTVDTFELIDPLIEDIKREFLPDPRFSVFFKHIERLGGPNDSSIKVFSKKKKKKAIESLQAKLFGENTASQQNFFLKDDYVCYASRPNSLVIRANGDIGKCTTVLYDERNKVGSLKPDGTLELEPSRLNLWTRGIKTLDPMTLACPLIKLPH